MVKAKLVVSALVAGGLWAQAAHADPRESLAHTKNGAQVQSTYSADGTASPTKRSKMGEGEKLALSPAMMERAAIVEQDKVSKGESPRLEKDFKCESGGKCHEAKSEHASALASHPLVDTGDSPAESTRGVESASTKLGRTSKDGERPHFSAAQAEELGSSQPARDDIQGSSKTHAGTQLAAKPAQSSGERLHLAPQQMQELRPEGAGSTSTGPASHSPSFERAEARFDREMPEPRAGVMERAQPDVKLPQAFFR